MSLCEIKEFQGIPDKFKEFQGPLKTKNKFKEFSRTFKERTDPVHIKRFRLSRASYEQIMHELFFPCEVIFLLLLFTYQ